jgi:hypothetical protein
MPRLAVVTMSVHRNAAMRKRARPASESRSSDVETIRVRRDVWAAALKAAQGDPRKIRIISERRVEIIGLGATA